MMTLRNTVPAPACGKRNRLPGAAAAWLSLGLALAALGLHIPRSAPGAEPRWPSDLAQFLAAPRFAGATWGIQVVALDSGAVRFAHNPNKLLKPASTAKLYVAALALDRFGSTHTIRTSVLARHKPNPAGRLDGDLLIYGRGDPSFAARFNQGDYARSLQPLARAIAAAGIRHVNGDLIGDETFFHAPPFGTGWAWEDLQYYFGAEVSALTIDDNTVDLFISAGPSVGSPCSILCGPATPILNLRNRTRTGPHGTTPAITVHRLPGSDAVDIAGTLPLGRTNFLEAVTVPRPGRWFLARLREALQADGIRVDGSLQLGQSPEPTGPGPGRPEDHGWQELAAAESRPMAELVSRMMKHSQNLYAQLLLLQVGAASAASGTTPSATTETAALAALQNFLQAAGVPDGQALLEEGAGLSHGSLVTANATTILLRRMAQHREAQSFLNALPVAGVDGSLRPRLQDSPFQSTVQAKPGALRHVSALAGYLTAAGGERRAFAIMLNHYRPPSGQPSARREVDQVLEFIARESPPPLASGETNLNAQATSPQMHR